MKEINETLHLLEKCHVHEILPSGKAGKAPCWLCVKVS